MPETAGKGSAASALVAVSPAPLVELVLDSLASPHSRRAYHRALEEFFAWYPSNASGEGFTRAVLGRYRSHLIERGLSAASVNLSLVAPDSETRKGLRDRVLLGLLVGCGLRKEELAGLELTDIAQREGRWAIVDLVGKHGRGRTVEMPSWAKAANSTIAEFHRVFSALPIMLNE